MKRIFLATGILCLSFSTIWGQSVQNANGTQTTQTSQGQTTNASGANAAEGVVPGATASPGPIDETSFSIPDTPGDTNPASQNIQAFGIWDLLRMVIILALVVGAIYGIFYLIRRGNKVTQAQETQLIRIMGSQGLPGNRWVHLISVQKQVFLIGSSDASVNLISEITDQESIDEIKLMAAKETPGVGRKTFADLIGGVFGGNKGPEGRGSGNTVGKSGLDFIKRQRDRLRKM